MFKEIHYSQGSFNLPKIVQGTSCGVASMIQVLNYFDISYKSPEEVFKDFVLFGKYTRDIVSFEFESLPNFSVPYFFLKEGQQDSDIREDIETWKSANNVEDKFEILIEKSSEETEYLPTFLLKIGSDSRGMCKFLQKFGLKVDLYEFSGSENSLLNSEHMTPDENTFFRKLEEDLQQGHIVIASVTKSEIPYLKEEAIKVYGSESPELIATHLITLKHQNGKIFSIDPMIKDNDKSVVEVDPLHLSAALTKDRTRGNFLVISR